MAEVPAGELSKSVDIPEADLEITTMRSGGAGDALHWLLCSNVSHCMVLATALPTRLFAGKRRAASMPLLGAHP